MKLRDCRTLRMMQLSFFYFLAHRILLLGLPRLAGRAAMIAELKNSSTSTTDLGEGAVGWTGTLSMLQFPWFMMFLVVSTYISILKVPVPCTHTGLYI